MAFGNGPRVVTSGLVSNGTTNAATASGNLFYDTGSNVFNITGSTNISGSLTVNNTITAQTLVVNTITSSVDFITGSTRFGSLITNTHVFAGSVTMTGSLGVEIS